MIKLKDVRVKNEKYSPLSFFKLTGLKIQDVHVSVSAEYGDPALKLESIILENGTEMGCGGEHDWPYLEEYPDQEPPNTDIDTLQTLLDEEEAD